MQPENDTDDNDEYDDGNDNVGVVFEDDADAFNYNVMWWWKAPVIVCVDTRIHVCIYMALKCCPQNINK